MFAEIKEAVMDKTLKTFHGFHDPSTLRRALMKHVWANIGTKGLSIICRNVNLLLTEVSTTCGYKLTESTMEKVCNVIAHYWSLPDHRNSYAPQRNTKNMFQPCSISLRDPGLIREYINEFHVTYCKVWSLDTFSVAEFTA